MKTRSKLCMGCNKCIFYCPTHANNAILDEKNDNKIHVEQRFCIHCGECIISCDHDAREYTDDTEKFFEDLAKGKKINVVAAPAIRHNIPEYRRLFGYLASLGACDFYDVSFGANITTWGYMRAIEKFGIDSLIAQPCPVIVTYIENFKNELVDRLSPVHSPVLCTAIYMKKYANIEGEIAFLSPCIAKKVEFSDPNTHGNISYNVTYDKLIKYLQLNNIDISAYDAIEYKNLGGGLGFAYSRPGGLAENVKMYLGENVWIKQVEGIRRVMRYLDSYADRLKENKPVPMIIDALNCFEGCNNGTATEKSLETDQIDYNTDTMKKDVDKEASLKLLNYFDETLNLDDFIRKYTTQRFRKPKITEEMLDEVFNELGKITEADRNYNCFSCGFGNCKGFAEAIVLKQNHKENCFQYTKKQLASKAKELQHSQDEIVSSLNYASKIQKNMLPSEKEMGTTFSAYDVLWSPKDIVGGDIYWIKKFKDGALLCVSDCTGHGTPGALLTMLVVSSLETSVNDENYKNPTAIVRELNAKICTALNAKMSSGKGAWRSSTEINDGADLALMYISESGEVRMVVTGGVRVLVCNGEDVTDVKGQRIHIGDGSLNDETKIKEVTIEYDDRNKFYIATDGLFDQIGGEKHKPFGYRVVKQMVMDNHDKAMEEIFNIVVDAFEAHCVGENRRDDLTFLGFNP